MQEPQQILARLEHLKPEQIRLVIDSRSARWENRNAIMARARGIGQLVSRRLTNQTLSDAENLMSRVCRRAGIFDAGDLSTIQAATRELVMATLVREQLAPNEYQALVRCWQSVLPETTDLKAVGNLYMTQEELMAQQAVERTAREEITKPKAKETKREARAAGEPRALRDVKGSGDRKLLGDTSNGVRIKPSKDHPGMFFLIEGKANRRVYSGYLKSQHQAEEIIKQNGWRSLGLVGSRESAAKLDDKEGKSKKVSRPTVRQGGKANQTKEQVREEQRKEGEDEEVQVAGG